MASRPIIYWPLMVIAWAAIGGGGWLIHGAAPYEPTLAERSARADALMERANILAGSTAPAPAMPPPLGRDHWDMTGVALGGGAILAGLVLMGFASVVGSLGRIAARDR